MQKRSMIALLCLSVSAQAEQVNPTPAYELPPGMLHVVIPNLGEGSISVSGVGAEGLGQTQIGPCNIAPIANASFTILNSTALLNASNLSTSIRFRCSGTGNFTATTLSCLESANPGNFQNAVTRTWPVICNNLTVDNNTGLIYTPNIGTAIRLAGQPTIGSTASAQVDLKIRRGITNPSSLNVRDCTITGSEVSAFGSPPSNATMVIGQASALLALTCNRRATASNATLACTEVIGNSSVSVTWPLLCPAADLDILTLNGFE